MITILIVALDVACAMLLLLISEVPFTIICLVISDTIIIITITVMITILIVALDVTCAMLLLLVMIKLI